MTSCNFVPPNPNEIVEKLEEFNKLFVKFSEYLHCDADVLSTSVPNMIDIIIEVEKEKKKIAIFEQSSSISEVREISLYCHFILKKRPIIMTQEKFRQLPKNINEFFCVYLLMCTISLTIKPIGEKGAYFPEQYIKRLLYIFSNGDLSKDALHLLAITLQTFCKREV